MTVNAEQQQYSDDVQCAFADAIFKKMYTAKYGILFCCEENLQKIKLKFELLSLNNIKNPNLEIGVCVEE